MKIVLVALAMLLACLTSGAILLYRYVQRHEKQWENATVAAGNEGEAFGRGKTLEACVTEALTRLDRCGPIDMPCEGSARLFLQHCTLTAEMPSDFCNTVPKQSDIMRSAVWARAECMRRGPREPQRCARVITALQDYCGER